MTDLAFLILGQSNASGRGTDAPSSLDNAAQIFVYNNADARVAISSTEVDDTTGQTDTVSLDSLVGHSFDRSAADAIAGNLDPSDNVLLVPCAMGGSESREWIPGGDIAAPSPNYGTTRLFGNALRRAEAADALSDTVLAGAFVYQGEADAADSFRPQVHAMRWRNIARRLRELVGVSNLPFVFVRLPPTPGTGINATYWEAVRTAQARLPSLDPHFSLVQAPDGPFESDGSGVHLTTAAHEVLGPLVATAWLATARALELT